MTNLEDLRALWAALKRFTRKPTAAIGRLGAEASGRRQWQPPSWLAWAGRRVARGWHYLSANAVRAAIASLVVLASAGAWTW